MDPVPKLTEASLLRPASPRCVGSLPVGYCVKAVRPLVEVTAAMVQGSRSDVDLREISCGSA
eukprot:scaffold54959_cov86-Phaeocystis_antarctica.AAC.1